MTSEGFFLTIKKTIYCRYIGKGKPLGYYTSLPSLVCFTTETLGRLLAKYRSSVGYDDIDLYVMRLGRNLF